MPQEQHLALSTFCKFYFKKPTKLHRTPWGIFSSSLRKQLESGAPFGAQDAPTPVPESLPRAVGMMEPQLLQLLLLRFWGALGMSPCCVTVPCPGTGNKQLTLNTIAGSLVHPWLFPLEGISANPGHGIASAAALSTEKLPRLFW